MQVPYDLIVDRAYALINLMATSNDWSISFMMMDELDDYLLACGWTNFEFDSETLRRIDLNWEPILN